jgi:succinyl-CoA synthetase beta subunit
MPALPEYRTRELLLSQDVPVVPGIFIEPGSHLPSFPSGTAVYLKAQIPGATGRAKMGLVRRADTPESISEGLGELLGQESIEGVLVTDAVDVVEEHYAACMLDLGSSDRPPSGILLWSPEGGSGVEQRAGSLVRIPFSLLHPPDESLILGQTRPDELAPVLLGLVRTFCRYRLTVLEANPIAVLPDGSITVLDCRAEFEKKAVSKQDTELFSRPGSTESDQTPLEQAVESFNREDPSGTGFFRQNRETPPEKALRIATNLCGGGGKMLWEMATGGRNDIFTLNESDTSGGLSAFKSYRILRAVLAQKGAQALILTGSGMAFQNQYHLAAAVWKALRESPTPLPCLLRFGGTDEDLARDLIDRISGDLPVEVRVYPAEIFPNAMLDDLPAVALEEPVSVDLTDKPRGTPLFSVNVPPGDFYFFPELLDGDEVPAFVQACPTGFLGWNSEKGLPEVQPDTRCIGCLICEAVSLLDGNGELRIQLNLPGEVSI